MLTFRLLTVLALAAMPSLVAAQATPPDTDQAVALSQAAIGTQVDDFELVRSDGRSVRLSEFRGKPLLVQFIYTGCFQACPVSVRYLQRAVATARAALGPDAFSILTVGFNQPFDTPQAMAAFARDYAINDRHWHFLATDARTIAAFTRALGFTWYATPKGFDHVAQVTVLDAQGRVYRQIYGERFEAPLLVEPLKQLVTGAPVAQGDWRAWFEKVRLFCTVYDRSSGRYRLNYSLFIELFAGLTILSTVIFGLAREWRRQRKVRT